MATKMLINASHPEECRVAVVSEGILEELDVQVLTREATLGNIYKGVVNRVEPSLQALFVDYGASRNGFLSINDVHPSYFPESFENSRRRPRIQDVFKKDAHVLVQVAKEERQNKGAGLTTNLSLAGRYLVLMPGTDLCGVSRKIEDDVERGKLKEILQQLKLPENMGFIIRTAGMGRTKTELARDLEYLLRLWQAIEKNVSEQPAPALLYKEHDMVVRAIREHFSSEITEILIDDKETHRKVREFFQQVMPRYQSLVKLYQEKRPIFNKYQLEEQIEHVYRRRINLKSGGYIVIEPTEALVTIDVNSGGATKEKGIEETAYRVNMEAAPEVARQLRLRDLGGIIVIDFIDMTQKKHKQEVEKALKAVLRTDRAKTKILRISALGLLELSRQRLKSSLGTGEYLECPLCDGQGRVRSAEMSAVSVFRKIKSLLVKSEVTEVRATVPAKVAEYLLNNMRAQLVELETQYKARVNILVKQAIPDKDITVEAVKEDFHELPAAEPVVSQLLPALASEELEVPPQESVEEEVVKPVRKTGRRRRRTRKKTEPTAGEEAQALEPESVPMVEEEAVSGETEEVEAPVEAESAAGTEDLGVIAEDAVAEADEQPDLSVEPEAKVVEADTSPASEHEPSRNEQAEAPEEGVREERPETKTAREKSEEEESESPVRKSVLQRFLPFF